MYSKKNKTNPKILDDADAYFCHKTNSLCTHFQQVFSLPYKLELQNWKTPNSNCDHKYIQTTAYLRTTNDETSRGLDMKDSIVIQILSRDDWSNYMLHEVTSKLIQGNSLIVLSWNHHGVYAERPHRPTVRTVLHSYLWSK